MRRLIACAMLLLLPNLAWGAQPVSPAAMVAAHNEVRGELGLPALSWSDTLAADAAAWADELALKQECSMQHSESGQGENLYWASPTLWSDGRREVQAVSSEQVVADWAAERADYDYSRNRCRPGKACGHYTQIVWRDSKRVGCAKSICPDRGQIWVCRYDPPGNWVGRRPY